MSEHQLSDDVLTGPMAARELLGVSLDADESKVRNAYAHLVCQYRPSCAPQEFQNIRAAYEQLRPIRPYRVRCASNGVDTNRDSVRLAEVLPIGDDSTALDSEFADKYDELWRQAVDGNTAHVYRELVSLSQSENGRDETCLRLYWLLRMQPGLDAERRPVDWLVEGLQRAAGSSRLQELYRRELTADPRLAVEEDAAELIDRDASFGDLADLAAVRWRAAGRVDDVPVVRKDLLRLQHRLPVDEEITWSRLLFAAADQLAWFNDQQTEDLFQRCVDEVESLVHLHLELRWQYDRLDDLRGLVHGYRLLLQSPDVPNRWADLIRVSWLDDPRVIRQRLLPVVCEIAAAPQEGLAHFDAVHSASPVAARHLGELIKDLASDLSPPAETQVDAQLLEQVIRQRIWPANGAKYSTIRGRVLTLCTAYGIKPLDLGAVASGLAGFAIEGSQPIAAAIAADRSLQYVVAACRSV